MTALASSSVSWEKEEEGGGRGREVIYTKFVRTALQ
jgi:hypothetical protein